MNLEEIETDIYHDFCDISKTCREYFYGRKYLPRDFWKMDDDIVAIIAEVEKLEKDYDRYLKIKPKEED